MSTINAHAVIDALGALGSDMQAKGAAGVLPDGRAFRRFIKDILAVGNYKHPVDGWAWDVTPQRLQKLSETFATMQANGVDVEITRDHSGKAEDILGYVVGMFTLDDKLYAEMEFRGDDAISLAGVVRNVSIEVDPKMKDGNGRSYGEAITAVSLVKAPVYSGQGEFIAASRKPVAVLKFSQNGESGMKIEDLLKALGTAMGVEDLSAENVDEHLKELGSKRKSKDDQIAELTKQVETLTEKLADMSKSKGKKDDGEKGLSREMREIIDERRSDFADSLDALAGKTVTLSREVLAKIGELIGGGDKAPRVAMFSREGDTQTPAKAFVSILSSNAKDPVTPGSQTVKLSREDADKARKETDDTVNENLALIGQG